jgi:hypothetical protein
MHMRFDAKTTTTQHMSKSWFCWCMLLLVFRLCFIALRCVDPSCRPSHTFGGCDLRTSKHHQRNWRTEDTQYHLLSALECIKPQCKLRYNCLPRTGIAASAVPKRTCFMSCYCLSTMQHDYCTLLLHFKPTDANGATVTKTACT